jgi:hypothetical protein
MSKWKSLLLITLGLLAFLNGPSASAQNDATDKVAIILILDNSGSMKTSDPGDLRFTAARLFISLLDQGDAVGLIRFSTESQALTNGLVVIKSLTEKSTLSNLLYPIPADGYTDVKAAFEDAQIILSDPDRTGRRTVVIFLTDGKPEIAQIYPEYEDQALALARKFGVPVLSIALTSEAHTSFLTRLTVETQGSMIPANSAADLLDAYLEVFGQVKDRTVIGEGASPSPGQATLELDPALAPYIETVSFIVVKPEEVTVSLLDPNGQEISPDDPSIDYAMTEDQRFSVLTIALPAGGIWHFRLQGIGTAQARAILRSRLRTEIIQPRGVYEAGQPLTIVANLIEEQADGQTIKIIGEASFSALITRPDGTQESLDLLYDDGTHGDTLADDGNYSRQYVNTDLPGTYTVTIRGYKGVVHVESTSRFELIPFPEIMVNQPKDAHYDIRNSPVPLEIHLTRGIIPKLDQGTIMAYITTPSKATHEIELNGTDGTYSGEYLPTEDGEYLIVFTPQEATYQGLPYTHTASARFEAHIIPTIAILTQQIYLGTVEITTAREGLVINVTVKSNSRQTELLETHLNGLPDFYLADTDPLPVPAEGETNLSLHLAAQPQLSPGAITGQLVFTARKGVDLLNSVVPIRINIIQPTLKLKPTSIDLGLPASCFDWSSSFGVTLDSTSLQKENLEIIVQGVDGMTWSPEELELSPGESKIDLIISSTQRLPTGEYSAQLVIQGREGLQIEPETLPILIHVPPLWVYCKRNLIWGGLLSFIIFIALIIVGKRIKAAIAAPPPRVTGTLLHKPISLSGKAEEFDLTALEQTRVSIGRGPDCDLSIPDTSLDEVHAIVLAERVGENEVVLLRPIGEVKIGYRSLGHDKPLQHRDTFTMGERMFQYLSDEGE